MAKKLEGLEVNRNNFEMREDDEERTEAIALKK